MPTFDYLIHKLMSRFNTHTHYGGEGGAIPAWTLLYNPTEKTANYTVKETDMFISCDGSFTLIFPPVSDGKRYLIKNIGTGTITLDPDGVETIDGQSLLQLKLQYDYLDMIGSVEWLIVGGGNVKIEELLNKLLSAEADLLREILTETRESKLHLASMSDANVSKKDAEA